jgi:hypothetical protein
MQVAKNERKYISDLHFEHQVWLAELKFYEEELGIYQRWLEEVASKNTGHEVMRHLEHFQNQFVIQSTNLRTLKHDVKLHEDWLSNYAEVHPVAVDHKYFKDHDGLRDGIESFKHVFVDLKQEYKKWLAEVM